MKNHASAKVMLSISMAIFGTLGLFTRNILLSSGELALYRAVLASGLVLIIGVGNMGQGGNDLLGILFGLGAAVFYAAVILLNKFIKKVTGVHRTLFQFFSAILILIPYVAGTGSTHLTELSAFGWICLLTVGIVHTGITYCMYFSALKDLTGQEAAILSYIDPLVAVLISVVVLGETMTFMQVLGGMFILGFTLWNEKT